MHQVTAAPPQFPGQLVLPLVWPDPVAPPPPPAPPEPDRDRWRLVWSVGLDRWLIYSPGAKLATDAEAESVQVDFGRGARARREATAYVERVEVGQRTKVIRWQRRKGGYHVAVTRQLAAAEAEFYLDTDDTLRCRPRQPAPPR